MKVKTKTRLNRIKKYLKDCAIPRLRPEAQCINKYSLGYGAIWTPFTVVVTTDNPKHFDAYLASIKNMLGEELGVERAGALAVCVLVENEVVVYYEYRG